MIKLFYIRFILLKHLFTIRFLTISIFWIEKTSCSRLKRSGCQESTNPGKKFKSHLRPVFILAKSDEGKYKKSSSSVLESEVNRRNWTHKRAPAQKLLSGYAGILLFNRLEVLSVYNEVVLSYHTNPDAYARVVIFVNWRLLNLAVYRTTSRRGNTVCPQLN